MNKTKAREWLMAVRKLSAYYRFENDNFLERCPLCNVSRDGDGMLECSNCLWVLFSKQPCNAGYWPCDIYSNRHLAVDAVDMRSTRNPRAVQLSLARLKRWEKRLIEIIEAKP